MNVQDMYAESVAFLERAVTQVARIFPVSLVNTSGVLKVLVSIILVSKHFTTPVTSEAVPTCCRKDAISSVILHDINEWLSKLL